MLVVTMIPMIRGIIMLNIIPIFSFSTLVSSGGEFMSLSSS